jgi:hypothetical protein
MVANELKTATELLKNLVFFRSLRKGISWTQNKAHVFYGCIAVDHELAAHHNL